MYGKSILPNSRFPLTSQSNKRNLERLYIWVVVVVVVIVVVVVVCTRS